MQILAINTVTEACSVALLNNGIYFTHLERCPKEHTRRVLPLVEEILNQGNTALTKLEALAFGRGPGSFTGIRIGIGIAQGLALGANLPMIGISTLATIAQGVFRQTGVTNVLVAIDARMGEVYWGEYTRDDHGLWHGEETEAIFKIEMIDIRLKTLSGLWAMAGTGWKNWNNMTKDMIQDNSLILVDSNILLPTAEDMLPIAYQLILAGKTVAVECAEPVYLRNEVARKMNRRKRNT